MQCYMTLCTMTTTMCEVQDTDFSQLMEKIFYVHVRCVLICVFFIAGAKKDFSCGDRKFAANVGLTFATPEEFFGGSEECKKFSWGEFDPRCINFSSCLPEFDPPIGKVACVGPEVVVFVGFPASGKTTFYETMMKPEGYVHVNRDKLGSWQKCVSVCESELLKGRKVVIDNTNPDVESRSRYICCAKKHSVPIRCFQFMTSFAHSKHNNKFRELTSKDANYVKVSNIAFNSYKSKFIQPSTEEGFNDVIRIKIHPNIIKDFLTLYKQFLE